MKNPVKVQIPFAGFYETLHDDSIDRAVQSSFEDDQGDLKPPYDEAIWAADVDWAAIRREYCQAFTVAFADYFGLTIEFDEMLSPREYNFSTDRLFVMMERADVDRIRSEVQTNAKWADVVHERFTSRDGFWSFYSPDLHDEKWTREILDECQYEVMIQFWIDQKHEVDPHNVPEWNELEYQLMEYTEVYAFKSVNDAYGVIEDHVKKEAK